MASTNKTTHYELSQFLGTDKPAWLTDYNSDMSKIDTGINTAQSTATGADGKADANATNIGNLENLTTTAKTSLVAAINEVDGNADGAQNTATSANSTAVSALSKINTLESELNLTTVTDLTPSTNYGSIAFSNVKSARNADNTMGKIYGKVAVNTSSTTQLSITVTIPNAFGTLDAGFNVNGLAFRDLRKNGAATWQAFDISDFTINANGSVTITCGVYSDTTELEIYFVGGLIFLQDFGD